MTLNNQPYTVLNANGFLRNALMGNANPVSYCHRRTVFTNTSILLGKVLSKFKVRQGSDSDDIVDDDLILVWLQQSRVITGADFLGRLLRGKTVNGIAKTV